MTTYSTPLRFVQPILQFNDETGLWRLTDDYCFIWTDGKAIQWKFYIQSGIEYDKASVPGPLRGLARTDGPWEGPSFFHDMCYKSCQHGGSFPPGMLQNKQNGGPWTDVKSVTRWWSDDLLSYTAGLAKVGMWDRNEYKWAVRVAPENWFKGF